MNYLMIFRNFFKIWRGVKDFNIFFEIIEKPFLQIEITQNDIEGESSCKSIHKYLDKFYIKGNILDKIFLKWYINTYFNMELNENYELHVIDSDIYMFNIKCDKCIKFKNDGNDKSYCIINRQ